MSLHLSELACTRGERELFSNIEAQYGPGDAVRVAGANGTGKTSLLRMLCGLACPSHGKVLWNGRDVRALREEFSAKLIYLGHGNGVKDDLAAWENVVVAATLGGRHVTREQAYDALEALGIGHVADLPTRSLSQGQRKRVALARLQLGGSQPLWILDEAFVALDVKAVGALCATLSGHLAQGGIVIYTTHQEIDLSSGRKLLLDLNQERPC